ncbi:MAG: TRZ/ATZ family protein [Clostridiaceae bacterium]|jgi:fumarate hydratase subunit beta|nr:fumarate hydratase C-terminal domain-containing protein [Clostridia bacterium]NLV34270.1 TRZ/ATZ family protein [Clostridiaceae bacterium]
MIEINTPFTKNSLISLKPFDRVLITGVIYIARDQAHKKMFEEGLPFNPEGQCIYHCGPSDAKKNMIIGSAGPTSSYRMNKYMPYLFDKGIKAFIGKGMISDSVIENMKKNKCVYFGAIGGLGAKLSMCIKKQKIIAYESLGTEALREIYVEKFPAIVIINCDGESIYERDNNKYE